MNSIRYSIILVTVLIMGIPLSMGRIDATSSYCSWKDFNDDYIDTDGDEEKDDYGSFRIGERIKIIDVLEDFESLGFGLTLLTLRSLPDEKVLFGNTLDSSIQKGKGIILTVEIIASTEVDGDACEYYEVYSIVVNVKDDGGSDPIESDTDYTALVVTCGVCTVPWVIIIIAVIWIYQRNKKKQKQKLEIRPPERKKEEFLGYATPSYTGQRTEVGDRTGIDDIHVGSTVSGQFQRPRETAPVETMVQTDSSGLDEFMAQLDLKEDLRGDSDGIHQD